MINPEKEHLVEAGEKPKSVSEPLLTSPTATKEKLVLFGLVDLTEWSENAQAGILAGGALMSSLGFAYLQEK